MTYIETPGPIDRTPETPGSGKKRDLYFIQNITILLISSHKASLLEASGDSQTAENPSHILPPALLADKRNNNFLKLKC